MHEFFAHTDIRNPSALPEDGARWQPLHEHLLAVANLSESMARAASPGDPTFAEAARWAGLLHDLGKYQDDFQAMLRQVAAGGAKARVRHAVFGASYAAARRAYDVAACVYGHHAGLPDTTTIKGILREERELAETLATQRAMGRADLAALLTRDVPPLPKDTNPAALDLRIRMLASCLVDADRLDSAAFDLGEITESPLLDAPRLLERLQAHVASLAANAPDGTVKQARADVLNACLDAASWPERLLSLTVPTGGGKTLASMAFALKRAAFNPEGTHRIIVVIPYLSIIEQNAEVYSGVFGANAVVEHHSNAAAQASMSTDAGRSEQPPPPSERRLRLAIENWDAPIVVTTSVRFFESLFSNRPSDLRRLHNIAQATVILDEVQTLPRHLLGALLSMMRGLADDWGTTFLFCTATQPAFERSATNGDDDSRWPPGTIREVINDPAALARQLRRTSVSWPKIDSDGRPTVTAWDEVAAKMMQSKRALCVTNTKRQARALWDALRQSGDGASDTIFHLSTRMCPQHRLDVIARIREHLARQGGECLVASTQLVEAGVDLDFPLVLRAMGPLDSIAQAAGRCDREGRLTAQLGRPAGEVIVFNPEDDALPPGAYSAAAQITRRRALGGQLSIHEIGHIRAYFHEYYQADLDRDDVEALRRKLDFPQVADAFVMIDNATEGVLVPYNEEARSLIATAERQGGLDRHLLRRMQRYQVGLYPHELRAAWDTGVLRRTDHSDLIICAAGAYDRSVGLEFTFSAEALFL